MANILSSMSYADLSGLFKKDLALKDLIRECACNCIKHLINMSDKIKKDELTKFTLDKFTELSRLLTTYKQELKQLKQEYPDDYESESVDDMNIDLLDQINAMLGKA